MRELTFRAWNRVTKSMWWFDVRWGMKYGIGQGYIGMLPVGEEYKRDFYGDNRQSIDPSECDLMQFTGLTDRFRREIWEGDIVSINEKINCEVRFERGAFRFLHKGKYDFTGLDDNIKVIGNIYENPEIRQKAFSK